MLELTPRSEDILLTLTHRLPLLTEGQIARAWFDSSAACAKSELDALDGLLNQLQLSARPELELTGPVFCFQPNQPRPDFGPVAYRLRTRWKAAATDHTIYTATARAKHLLGGYLGGRKPRPSEITHDVHLAQVYLRCRRDRPELVNAWVPEAELLAESSGQHQRFPDATIWDPKSGTRVLLIEFGGAYSKQKLEAFHAACCETSYEIW